MCRSLISSQWRGAKSALCSEEPHADTRCMRWTCVISACVATTTSRSTPSTAACCLPSTMSIGTLAAEPRKVGGTKKKSVSALIAGAATAAPPPKAVSAKPVANPRLSGNQRKSVLTGEMYLRAVKS